MVEGLPATSSLRPFETLPYERPDEAFLDDLFRKTRLTLKGQKTAAGFKETLQAFEAAWLHVVSNARLAKIRRVIGPDHAFYEAECEAIVAQNVTHLLRLQEMVEGLDEHRLRREVEPDIGAFIFREARQLNATISRTIETELKEEAALKAALRAFTFAGDGYSHSEKRHFAWDDVEGQFDSELRRRAYLEQAENVAFTLRQREKIFNDLILTRTKMATKMGYRDYVEYALVRYGIERGQLAKRAQFRAHVVHYIVPLCRQIRRLQVQRLGKNELEPADYYLLMREMWPGTELQPQAIDEAYRASLKSLIGSLGDFFAALSLQGYVNYDQEAAKALSHPSFFIPSANAVYLNVGDEKLSTFVPALFYSTGVAIADSIAFYERRKILAFRASLLTRALAGTAVMMLSKQEWERFLGRASGLALELELTRRVLELPLMCAVEAFEEQLYLHPEWNLASRSQVWRRLKRIYLPDEAEGDHLSVMPYAVDWLTVDSLVDTPLRHTEQAMADIMVFASKPYVGKGGVRELEQNMKRLVGDKSHLAPLDMALEAGFHSPYEASTFRMAAFTIAMLLGL